MTGVALRNLAIQATSGGHGIHFKGVQNSVIDSCTIVLGFRERHLSRNRRRHNLVMNNTVLNTANQHAIAVQGSSDNVIVGNTISGAKLEGILVTADLIRPSEAGGTVSSGTPSRDMESMASRSSTAARRTTSG